jgi:acetate kinase
MKILVANLGSTSFKYQLIDMDGERQLARGEIERIGSAESRCVVRIGDRRREETFPVPDHGEAVRICLAELTHPELGCIKDAAEVSAIGFKAVLGGRVDGVQRVTDEVIGAMQEAADIAPAHNPAYIAAMRALRQRFPQMPLVAAFETDFHRTIPDCNRHYAVPLEWAEKGLVRRWGYHGASHRYIATRTAEILGRADLLEGNEPSGKMPDLRIISCHLGGSSSVCAIRNGRSVANSFGMSAQTGLPHNNRVGDFDPFALPVVMKLTGKSLEEVLKMLASQSGLLGLSGLSSDLRDLEAAAASGNARAKLAINVLASAVRHYIGAYLVELGGADAIVFTGGIGENRVEFRAAVLRNLEELGIVLDPAANRQAKGEARISASESRVQVWVMPTNEELIVARQAKRLLEAERCSSPK